MKLEADESLLGMVLTNLIRNACEATEGMPDADIRVVATDSGGSPYIMVSDNGPGIPEGMPGLILCACIYQKNRFPGCY